MKNIIIVGAGGFGREALYFTKAAKESYGYEWNIKGFIDDNLSSLSGVDCDYPVLGTIKDWVVGPDDLYVLGVASPNAKEKIVQIMEAKGAEFVTVVHPAAQIYEKSKIGKGCVISGRASVGDCAVIGDFVHLAGCMVGQDAHVGDYSTVTGFANITTASLGKKVFVGSHAVVLNGISIGDGAYICAGSVVFSKVKPGMKVIGYPAKRMEF